MKKLLAAAATLLLLLGGGTAYAQKSKSVITGEISQSTAATKFGGAILNDIINSYVDSLTCTGAGGMVYWGPLITPLCLGAGLNGQTLSMVGGFPAWTSAGANTTRVTVNFPVVSSTTLVNVTGLTATLTGGLTYTFSARLYFTDAAAGGIQAAICGTATATNIVYEGRSIDAGSNLIKEETQATSLCTPVGSSTTTGTNGIIEINGTITVNTAGTLTVQFAQNTSNATSSIVLQGSTFSVNNIQ